MHAGIFRVHGLGGRVVAWGAVLAMCGCAHDVNGNGQHSTALEEENLTTAQEQLAEWQSAMRRAELRPLSSEEIAVIEYKSERRRYFERIRDETGRLMVPLVITLSLFASEGPVDLLLSVYPPARLGRVRGVARKVRAARRARKNTRKLLDEFGRGLDGASREFLYLAGKLSRKELEALWVISRRTRSPEVMHKLLRKHVAGQADVRWIAEMVKKNKFDGQFVERFSFGGDLLEDFTLYDANPSWKTLERAVKGHKISPGARGALAHKVRACSRRTRPWISCAAATSPSATCAAAASSSSSPGV